MFGLRLWELILLWFVVAGAAADVALLLRLIRRTPNRWGIPRFTLRGLLVLTAFIAVGVVVCQRLPFNFAANTSAGIVATARWNDEQFLDLFYMNWDNWKSPGSIQVVGRHSCGRFGDGMFIELGQRRLLQIDRRGWGLSLFIDRTEWISIKLG